MIYDDITEFAAALPAMRALIGLDLGEKTIGVAVSDQMLSVASPLQKAAENLAAATKAQLERDANMASGGTDTLSTNIVNAPTNNNIHNNGSMVGGSQSIVNPKYGSLNTEGV